MWLHERIHMGKCDDLVKVIEEKLQIKLPQVEELNWNETGHIQENDELKIIIDFF